MAEILEKTGKTVEEALDAALAELGVTRDEVEWTVLSEPSKGVFGIFGAKPAKIEVRVKQVVSSEAFAEVTETEPETDEKVTTDDCQVMDIAGSKSVKIARTFLQDVLAAMNIVVEIKGSVSEEGYVFELVGDDLGILIGKHGQTLDSLQYLLNLAANKDRSEPRVHIVIDIENYRSRREETLKRLAARLADKAYQLGREVKLEPMNRHERKIIHMALQDSERVETFSDGEEPYRYVVIAPKWTTRRSRK